MTAAWGSDAAAIGLVVAILALACIGDPQSAAPDIPELVDIAKMLHDIIFDLTDPNASPLQATIVDLCEAWWLGERHGEQAVDVEDQGSLPGMPDILEHLLTALASGLLALI